MQHTTVVNPAGNETRLSFGTVFAPHMLLAEFDDGIGWHDWRIEPYGPLRFDPAAAGLHYGQSVFDGLKAYRASDGHIRLFRPERHIDRLDRSARRLSMPALDQAAVLSWLLELVRRDQDYVPSSPGSSLYLRPVVTATEPFLGVRPARSYILFIVASPVGAYYAGDAPLKILVEEHYARVAKDGIGAAKAAANYAAGLLATEEAQAAGFDQVLWLDGTERRYLEEIGTMNVIVRIGDEVVTPPLSGTILDGVVRDSVLTLLREWEIPVSERPIDIEEVVSAARSGSLLEAWGTGTASGIQPIGEFSYRKERLPISDPGNDNLTRRLSEALAAIQYGSAPDVHRWMVQL